MASVLQARETLCAPRVNERERKEKRRGEVTYQAGVDRSGGEEGESKRERESGEDRERGCDRWRKDDRGRGRRVDPPSVLSPIILSSRVSLTNVARSSDPSAIHDDARERPGDGRASSTTNELDHLRHDQRAVRTCVCVCVCVCHPDMRSSKEDSRRRNDGSRETTDSA